MSPKKRMKEKYVFFICESLYTDNLTYSINKHPLTLHFSLNRTSVPCGKTVFFWYQWHDLINIIFFHLFFLRSILKFGLTEKYRSAANNSN